MSKYLTETITLHDGTRNEILLCDYEIFGCDHGYGVHDVIKPLIREGYEKAMGTASLLRECGYGRIVINPGRPHRDTRVSML